MEHLQATTLLEEFISKISNQLESGKEIHERVIADMEDYTKANAAFEVWASETTSILKESFLPEENRWLKRFVLSGTKASILDELDDSFYSQINILRAKLESKSNSLKYIKNIVQICDLIINPINDDIVNRSNYKINEKLDFILKKLYTLYSTNEYYGLLDILDGNGISYAHAEEVSALAEKLKKKKFVAVYGSTEKSSVRVKLTTEGAMYVEEKLIGKVTGPMHSKKDKTVNEKIDEIIEHLKTQGYGQELIYNELQEMKEHCANPNIKKKTLGEIIKGKMVDVAMGKVIGTVADKVLSMKTLAEVYQVVTGHQFPYMNVLSSHT